MSDLQIAAALDRIAYGADRRLMLEHRWRQAERGAMLHDTSGFAFLIPQEENQIIGPVIAANEDGALDLISALALECKKPVRVDVPRWQPDLIGKLEAEGFQIRHIRPFMLHGASALPGRREMLFGCAALAFG
jgi:hypothetical protein